jgi:ribonuclease HI
MGADGLVVHFDGLCEPKNPGGVATFGFTVERDGRPVHEESGLAARPYSEEATNNVAEYTGVLRALEWLVAEGLEKERVLVRGDSDLVIKQLNGEYKVKSPLLAPLHRKARELALRFPSLRFEWVPREKNRQADALTNRAYAEFQGEGRKTVRVELMKVELTVRADADDVREALRKASIAGTAAAEKGGTRVTASVAADVEAVRRLLDLKRRLEGL